MRSIFIAVTLLISSAAAASQPVGWQSYEIPETGTKVDLPVTIFTKENIASPKAAMVVAC